MYKFFENVIFLPENAFTNMHKKYTSWFTRPFSFQKITESLIIKDLDYDSLETATW